MKSKAAAMAIIILLVTLLSTGWTSGEQTRPKAWEYKVTVVDFHSNEAQRILNQAGAEGWELAEAVPTGHGGGESYVSFKRPK